jgi:hypothetical protein
MLIAACDTSPGINGNGSNNEQYNKDNKTNNRVLLELKQHLGKAVTLLICLPNKKKVEPGVLANELSLL